jgi:hypothetical protein
MMPNLPRYEYPGLACYEGRSPLVFIMLMKLVSMLLKKTKKGESKLVV